MSGGIGAQRLQVSPRAEKRRSEWWQLMLTDVRGRLARIDRGESTPPSAQHVRCWRVLAAPEQQR